MVKIDWKLHGCKHCPFLLPKSKNTSVCIDFAHILKKKDVLQNWRRNKWDQPLS